jgi:hypothetical protein
MSTHDRNAKILGRAEELAQSGRYGSWIEIERVLVTEGHASASRLLHSKAKRSWLDALCTRHTRKPVI